MKYLLVPFSVLALVSSFAAADQPQASKRKFVERNISMHLGIGGENLSLSFDKDKDPERQIASVKIVVDGKTTKLLKPGGESFEDFKAVSRTDTKSGKDKIGLEFTGTKKRSNTYELTPVFKDGQESDITLKLRIEITD